MKRALERLSRRFPTAGLVLQLGDKFYEHRDGQLREVPWVGATPPPVVTRMSAINLPRHGKIFLYPKPGHSVPCITCPGFSHFCGTSRTRAITGCLKRLSPTASGPAEANYRHFS